MAGLTFYPGADARPLEAGWTLLVTEAGRYASPGEIHRPAVRIGASVPGTVAGALAAASLYDPQHPDALHGKDAWYFRSLAGEQPGPAILRFEGLATIAEIYVNGEQRLTSDSMFQAHDLPIDLTGDDELAICFRALEPHLSSKAPRARWRPQMMDNQGLRFVRTTTLGHMPGWCPEIHPVGPHRPITLIRSAGLAISDLLLNATLEKDGSGHLSVSFRLDGVTDDVILRCGGTETPMSPKAGCFSAALAIPDIEPWWPHTHGVPRLYEVAVDLESTRHSLGLVGFRRVEIDRGVDGRDFALRVNGEPVFCRGAVWTNADILSLPGSAESYAPWLAQAVEASMNMIRIGGTMTYESPDFFRLCDRLGIMVWQDFMFANFDYPAGDEKLLASVEREVRQVLGASQGSPSLTVLCGGSEVYQQGAMLGLPERIWKNPLFEAFLPGLSAGLRPDVAYVENSPCGGAMPFSPDTGVTHYYGVGAYCRPLEDARRANVRFAAECLAFANVPQQSMIDRDLPVAPVHDPRWKAGVPRDRGASWDFEDVRDHYLRELYGFDPARLRREDSARYLDFSRAATTEIVTETYAEWRRPSSTCNGALIWTLQDLVPGAGWGVVDSTGEPKPVWYGLKRALRPVQLLLADDGTNGLYLHAINETAKALEVVVELACLRDGRQTVVSGQKVLSLAPRGHRTLAATDLFGAFFDTTYAFRFGPPSHEVTIGRLRNAESGEVLAEAFHFPLGRAAALFAAEIAAVAVQRNGQWWLELKTDRLAQSVHVTMDGFRAADDWFHLTPGEGRSLPLVPRDTTAPGASPSGTVAFLGSSRLSSF